MSFFREPHRLCHAAIAPGRANNLLLRPLKSICGSKWLFGVASDVLNEKSELLFTCGGGYVRWADLYI